MLRRFLAGHLGSDDVARVIYGSILGLALVVALEHHPPGPAETTVALLGAAVAVGLAELYSEFVGSEVNQHRHVRRAELRSMAVDALA